MKAQHECVILLLCHLVSVTRAVRCSVIKWWQGNTSRGGELMFISGLSQPAYCVSCEIVFRDTKG